MRCAVISTLDSGGARHSRDHGVPRRKQRRLSRPRERVPPPAPPLSYPSYQTTTAGLSDYAIIEGLPTRFFISPTGRVLYLHTGPYETQRTLDRPASLAVAANLIHETLRAAQSSRAAPPRDSFGRTSPRATFSDSIACCPRSSSPAAPPRDSFGRTSRRTTFSDSMACWSTRPWRQADSGRGPHTAGRGSRRGVLSTAV